MLQILVLGSPLSDRENDTAVASEVQTHFNALVVLFEEIYGGAESWRFLKTMLEEIQAVQNFASRMQIQRILLLHALWLVPEATDWYVQNDSTSIAHDLKTRIMPFVGPRFLKTGAQSVGRMAGLCAVLHHMWGGELLSACGHGKDLQ